jgi:hypothetical protein
MDDLTHLWKNFTLTEDESCAVEASVQGLHHIVDRGENLPCGKAIGGSSHWEECNSVYVDQGLETGW